MENKGVIYILTNPSFPDYVKIGYADDIDKRLKQLNRSECIPFAFRVYATYEVNSRLSDLKLHSIIDKLNPDLRSIDDFNGQKRVREFYAIALRTGLHCAPLAHQFIGTYPAGTIRFSVNYFTSQQDFEELRNALDYIEENL